MLGGLFVASLIVSCVQAIKEAWEPEIPAENWANKELYHQDIMNGVPIEERMRNVRNGKYKLTEKHPEPHRTADGRIIIENCDLYNEDVKNYGAYQAQKWVQQGKYNLTPEELKKKHEEHEAKLEYIKSLL